MDFSPTTLDGARCQNENLELPEEQISLFHALTRQMTPRGPSSLVGLIVPGEPKYQKTFVDVDSCSTQRVVGILVEHG
jgi:hypothetical protein